MKPNQFEATRIRPKGCDPTLVKDNVKGNNSPCISFVGKSLNVTCKLCASERKRDRVQGKRTRHREYYRKWHCVDVL